MKKPKEDTLPMHIRIALGVVGGMYFRAWYSSDPGLIQQ